MEEDKMSKLSKLMGKPKDFVIGGETFTIHPLTVEEDLEIVLQMTEPDKMGKAMHELIRRTIKRSVPDATEDELKGVALKYFKEFKEAIQDVNGLIDDVPEEQSTEVKE